MLFSTSITSFSQWKVTDKFSDPPDERLDTLSKIQERGIPTNVLIKPFLFGITDKDLCIYQNELIKKKVLTCVVGLFYWNNRIINFLGKSELITTQLLETISNKSETTKLPCIPSEVYYTYSPKLLDDFCDKLATTGINVFKNTDCVSAWYLKKPQIWGLYKNDTKGLCVRCGNCE